MWLTVGRMYVSVKGTCTGSKDVWLLWYSCIRKYEGRSKNNQEEGLNFLSLFYIGIE